MRRSWIKRKSKDPKKQAVNKLDTYFSKMIRDRDANLPCISCGAVGRQIDAGHFRPRGHMSTRWDYKNVNGQCVKCNRFESKGYEYSLGLDARWGKGTADALHKLSLKMKSWELKELEQLIDASKKGYIIYKQFYDQISH